jgi:hypothetical protein
MMRIIKAILLSAVLLSTLSGAHTITLVIHKNDQMHSSGAIVCNSVEHCKYLIKSYEYKRTGDCGWVEVKDGNRVVYRKYYKNY